MKRPNNPAISVHRIFLPVRIAFSVLLPCVIPYGLICAVFAVGPFGATPYYRFVSILLACASVYFFVALHRVRVSLNLEEGYMDMRGVFRERRVDLTSIHGVSHSSAGVSLYDARGRPVGLYVLVLARFEWLTKTLEGIAAENRARLRANHPGA